MKDKMIHTYFMNIALQEARLAASEGEVPVGCVIVRNENILGKAHNQTETLNDPTAHAEVLAITQAAAACGDWRLTDCMLYVTKEPCPMCAGAIVLARIPWVVWGVDDPKRGGGASVFNILQHPQLNHHVDILRGILGEESKKVLQDFFRVRRKK